MWRYILTVSVYCERKENVLVCAVGEVHEEGGETSLCDHVSLQALLVIDTEVITQHAP